MLESGRRFVVESESGRSFTVIEYSSYRWERNAHGERCQIQNDAVHLMTKCGLEVEPTDEADCYRIPVLGLEVRESGDASVRLTPSKAAAAHFSKRAAFV